MKIIGVYKIENLETQEIYIGVSRDIKKRWSHHLAELRGNTHRYEELQEGFNKNKLSFQILETIDNKGLSLEELEEKMDSLEKRHFHKVSVSDKELINIDTEQRYGRRIGKKTNTCKKGEANGANKCTNENVVAIRVMREHKIKKMPEIARQFGISESHAYKISSGFAWSHINKEDYSDLYEAVEKDLLLRVKADSFKGGLRE